jgi:hypothetical protein
MPSLNTQFEHELKKLIAARMADIADILCEGQAVKDYADYRQLVGQFHALRLVHDDFCSTVNTTLNQR